MTRLRRVSHPAAQLALCAGVLAIAMGIGRFAYTPLLPRMVADAAVSPAFGAGLASANYVGYLVGTAAGVVWHHRLVGRGPAVAAAALLVSTLAVTALSADAPLLLASRTLAGLASAVMFLTVVDASRHAARTRPALRGWTYSGVGVGIALSTLLGVAPSWQVGWWWCAGAAVLGVPMVLALSVPHAAVDASSPAGPPRGAVVRLYASYFAEGAAYIIGATFVVAALASAAPAVAPSAWLLVGLAVIPSAALWAVAGHRWGPRRALIACLLLQAVGLLALSWASPAGAIAGALLLGGTFMGATTVALGLAADLGGRRAPAAATLCYGVGQVLGPLAVAPTLSGGYGTAMIVAAGLAVAAAVAVPSR